MTAPTSGATHARLTDEALARFIRSDHIDILVELTGHIGDGRLHTLAYKPAPVQVSYIGYQATTGVAAVDYFLSDDWTDPAEVADQHYVERVVRLPKSFFVYAPPPEAPPVGPLPAIANGFVTFGCHNNLAKVTPRTIALWSEVLRGAGLALRLARPRSKEVDDALLAAFESHGVSRERIEIVRRATPRKYPQRTTASTWHWTRSRLTATQRPATRRGWGARP